MQQDAIDCATQALEKYNIEKDIAAFIKKEFDKKYNPTWSAATSARPRSYQECVQTKKLFLGVLNGVFEGFVVFLICLAYRGTFSFQIIRPDLKT